MSLGRSELETVMHKRRADEDLVIVYSRRKKKPKSGMIDSRSLFSAPVPYNDDWEKIKNLYANDWEKKVKDDMIASGSLFSPPLSHKDGLCREMKPKGANPFLCEGGFGSLSLFPTQAQKAAGEEIGFKFKTEMAKPLCEVAMLSLLRAMIAAAGEEVGFKSKEMPKPLCEDLSCGICGGAHHHTACDLRKHCPTDKKVGEGFLVICYCGNDLINGKCRLGCPPFGKAISGNSFYYPPPLGAEDCEKKVKADMIAFGSLFSPPLLHKDGLSREMKPNHVNPFLCEGGFESLSIQVPQKAAGEEIGFKFTKPLCEDLSCGICGGAHHHTSCDLRKHCPTDQKVGEGFLVICYCGNDLINGKCRLGCPPFGKAISL